MCAIIMVGLLTNILRHTPTKHTKTHIKRTSRKTEATPILSGVVERVIIIIDVVT